MPTAQAARPTWGRCPRGPLAGLTPHIAADHPKAVAPESQQPPSREPFFGSNALYPVSVMPAWLQAVSKANPLSYEVDALHGLLLGIPSHLGLDFGVLVVAAAVGVAAASLLLGRLAK